MTTSNPLLAPWTGPFGMPPFDSIRPEHFPPAFAAAMEEHLAEIAAIGTDPAAPTFANTIEALQRSGRALERIGNVFGNLTASLGGEALEELDRELSPQLAQHGMKVALDPSLFARVAALHAQRDRLGLEEDQLRLLDRTHLGFIRSGAALAPAEKARMSEISERLAVLHTAFGQNVLHDEKAWHLPLTEADLDGLPDFLRAGAAQAAVERGITGYAITLSRSLIEPFLTFSARRDLRRVAYEAWVARGTHPGAHDNRPLIPEILALRDERARLLGYPDFATFRLADSMAGSVEAAQGLLAEVWEPAKRRAAAERGRRLELARTEGFNDALAPWDWRYYSEKVRLADYALDEAELKSFFEFENIQRAAFDTAGRLFGLEFLRREDIPTYHPDVQAYEVRDEKGTVGVFLADPYARADKRSGAWMSSYRDQENLDAPVTPIIVNNNNFAKAKPTLLSFDDAETLFHEFGHALHGLLSQVRYPAQSGTSVRRDFVELPSQIYEHWVALPETLRQYALHHETGAPLPDALIERLRAAQTFNQGFATVEYVSSALIDMALHSHPAPESIEIDTFEREFLASIGMPAEIGIRHRPAHFQHLFAGGGYAAGYYSYLWSEVLDADGFEAFEETGNAFDPATAARLRRLLSAGDTRDPMQLYVEFRGREPSTKALLRNRGLQAAA
ncbi:M3 family metallopeptidase [Pseudoroseomonas ludipueritiae]|uniref:M3 family metallopeptidase n=1 Tax=Pseudoroseomonas ludipueritiae TaxID=198093 RepID=A0ABR7R2B8_9PROT|nr:M3 family metallopeptidase [Pseudoroseomonas ludipueritiae]MBC9175878.1 M3 family metallopeptidase [Pseudoroseomonas ludipueritiae]